METKSTLDLHGLHVDEAVTVLTKVIEDQTTSKTPMSPVFL